MGDGFDDRGSSDASAEVLGSRCRNVASAGRGRMWNRLRNLFWLGLSVLAFCVSCKHTVLGPRPSGPPWQSLGFKGEFASRLVIAEPYLYACAGPDGLWRLNLQRSDTNWVFLGLADPKNALGVEDVVVSQNHPEWLLALVKGRSPRVFRSLNDGESWSPSGGEIEDFKLSPDRFLQFPEFVLAAGGGVVFKTQDFGASWSKIYGQEPGLLDIDTFVFHPQFPNVVWMGGRDSYGDPYLAKSSDSGHHWREIDLRSVVSQVGGVNTILFTPVDSNLVYVGLSGEIIKTTGCGNSWKVIDEQGATAMLVDPQDPSHLWLSLGIVWRESFDGGATWEPLAEPPPTEISALDMIWDDRRKVVYVGALDGVYRFRP